MIIKVTPEITLTPYLKKDKPDLVRHINHPDIANNTLTIPYPYKKEDADIFFKMIQEKEKQTGRIWNWVIRDQDNNLIGSIGLLGREFLGNPYRDAFGYWIGKEFRGKGLMSKVVAIFSDYCLDERGIVRLEANVFAYNQASMRVLENAGFEREGYLKKTYLKKGDYLDSVLFAKTKRNE
ncbi:MAG: GNAT family N-acetyltransferase [Saprospiraceae bacterium]